MKVLKSFSFILLLAACCFSQSFQLKGNYGFYPEKNFGRHSDEFAHLKFMPDGNSLLIVGRNGFQRSRLEAEKSGEYIRYQEASSIFPGEISPDGRKVIDLSGSVRNPKYPQEKDKYIDSEARIFDLESGKRLFTFNRKVTGGFWSGNGKILITSAKSQIDQLIYKDYGDSDISIWNGESFENIANLSFKNLCWLFLSDDGKRLFTYRRGFSKDSPDKDIYEIWDTSSGKLEGRMGPRDAGFIMNGGMILSPAGNYLAMVSSKFSDQKERKLYIWDIKGSSSPIYAIAPDKEITSFDLTFSADGKSIALDLGDFVESFEITSGKSLLKFRNKRVPDQFLANGEIFFYSSLTSIEGFYSKNGDVAFREKAIYKTTKDSGSSLNNEESYSDEITVDSTSVLPSPDGKHFIASSNDSFRLFDAYGRLLIDILGNSTKHPFWPGSNAEKIRISRESIRRLSSAATYFEAGWAADGKYAYLANKDTNTITIWEKK